MWALRQEFVGRLLSIADAVEQARRLEGPVCLLDMGDNVGGGSPGDGTLLAQALLDRPLGEAFVCLYDPAAVQQAEALGAGGHGRFRLGGKSDDRHGPPLEVEITVRSLHEGRFEEPQVRHGGFRHFDQGRCAVLVSERGLTVLATSRRMAPFSLGQLTSCGLDPARFHVLVAKGVNAPVAAYAPVCKHFLRVNTPGVTTADMTTLPFHKRRRPMFPFEPETEWQC
jgi:microcystin degradation protein MlrC